MEKLLIFVGMALATYFTRVTMIAALGRQIPQRMQRWLRHVPAAILAALILPATLAPQGHLEVGIRAWSVLAGAFFAWRTRSVLWTIVGGMVIYWILRLLGL